MSVEIMKEAVEFMAEMKTPFYAWFGGALVIVIDDPDDAYTVLTSKYCMEKAFVYKFFNMGASLFTARGACVCCSSPIIYDTIHYKKYAFFHSFLQLRFGEHIAKY